MATIMSEFAKLQAKIRSKYGDDVERTLHEKALESTYKQLGQTKSGEECETFRKRAGLEKSEKFTDSRKCIKLLYDASRARILLTSENLQSYRGDTDVLQPKPREVVAPVERKWGFMLGDKIRVKGSSDKFKSMQKATLGWTGRLKSVYGHIGYVKSVMSEFDNVITVRFPDITAECQLHAVVLEKLIVKESDLDKPDQSPSPWKIGGFVRTQSDSQLIRFVERGPVLMGERGKIIGHAGKSVLVTFDGQIAHEINPALLIPSEESKPLVNTETHPRKFEIGQRVKVIRNMKKLIDNQKDMMKSGGWDEDMSSLRGKEVTILNINKHGSLNVQREYERAWRINSDSILKMDEDEEKATEELPFTRDDIVRVKVPPNIRSILDAADIPLTFIEYLRLTGEVSKVGDKYQPYVRFCNWRNTEFSSDLLRKLDSPGKEKKYLDAKAKAQALSEGDTVHLDVGPPNFVKDVLRSAGRDKSTIVALTNSATLKGYLGDDTAVIEYEDGSKYVIKKKFLTVPERFYIEGSGKDLDFEVSGRVIQAIDSAICGITKDKKMIQSVQIFSGNPPIIDIRTYCSVSHEHVAKWLQENCNWMVEILCKGQLMIRSDDFGKIKVGIEFREDLDKEREEAALETVERNKESGSAELEARPFVDQIPTPEQLRQCPVHYYRLYDPTLSKDVFVPYVVYGQRRNPMPQQNGGEPASNAPRSVNFFNTTVDSINIVS